jgi:perosamine synthetase
LNKPGPETEAKIGPPVRNIPYGRQLIDEDDIQAVVDVLRSDWLTTGPAVQAFEQAFADVVESSHAVAVSSGTAALHAAMFALGIGPGDEVIVPTMTFAATANSVVFEGGKPVFADVVPDTLLIDPNHVERLINPNTKAIIAVDYAGQPGDYDALKSIAERHNLALVADACHSLGASYKGRPAGSLADITVFSFHPVKHITTGEGGMVTTNDPELGARTKIFRNHGITTDHRQRMEQGSWHYEMVELGYNYRITDIQCALGLSQLKKLSRWIARRQELAAMYDKAFDGVEGIEPLLTASDVSHAYHLYVIRLGTRDGQPLRSVVFSELRSRGIGVNVHYIPVHLHPYYRKTFNTGPGLCPVAEKAYENILSLPMYPGMSNDDVRRIAEDLCDACKPRG